MAMAESAAEIRDGALLQLLHHKVKPLYRVLLLCSALLVSLPSFTAHDAQSSGLSHLRACRCLGAVMSAATAPPTVTSPTSSSSSSASLPPLSVLLSAPSLDPYVSQLDEATLAQLYNQPPPLGSPATSASPSAVYSSAAAVDSLQRLDASLAVAIESAWKLSLHLDAGPDSAAAAIGGSQSALSVEPAVTSFLSSLAALDAAARQSERELFVPQSLLEQLDEGRNPERGLAELMEQLTAGNDRARGRAIATHSLREAIEQYGEAAEAAAERQRGSRERSGEAPQHSSQLAKPQTASEMEGVSE